MAQDAMRLWNSPRAVRVCIHGLEKEQVQRFSAALGKEESASAGTDDSGKHVFERILAGNTLFFVEGALDEADLLGGLRRTYTSPARIEYMFRGKSPEPKKAESSDTRVRKELTGREFPLIAEKTTGS
jgi:hypothetical protein